MISMQFVGEFNFILDTVDDCHNPGIACYGCPAYDACDHHVEDDDEN